MRHTHNDGAIEFSVTGTSGQVVRYACDRCCRFWFTDAELQAHTCGEADAIVRELSERGPFRDDLGCADCNVSYADVSYDENAFVLPANHEPSCLWRRARELHAHE